jgi:virginiamycin B lyase
MALTIRTNHLCAVALAAVLLASLWLAARAEAGAKVYWAHFNGSTLESVPADGSEPPQVLVSGASNPLGVAVDATHVYWANFSGHSIGRANLDGTEVEQGFISGIDPYALAVAAGHVYWTDAGAESIGRADLDGGEVEPGFIEDVGAFFGLAADAEHLYWGNLEDEAIARAGLDGSEVEREFVDTAGLLTPYGVAVDLGHVYWANSQNDSIGRADLDGGEVEEAFIHGAHPAGVAVDAGHVYWGYAIYQGALGRANVDGSGIDNNWMPSGSTDAFGVAVTPLPFTPKKKPEAPSTGAAGTPTRCAPVATSAATFTPRARAGRLVPGVRALITVSTPSHLEVEASLTYGLHGKSRRIDLGAHSVHASSRAKLRLPLPAGMRSAPAFGTKVKVTLETAATPDDAPGCTLAGPTLSTFKGRIVRVIAQT